MLEFPHVAVGVAIAANVSNPVIALPLALASHFAFDFLPHWNPSLYTEYKKLGGPSRTSSLIVVFDTTAALLLGFWAASLFLPEGLKFFTVLVAAFLAVAPDVVEGFYFYLKVKSKFLENLVRFQHNHQVNASIVPGLITQAAVVIISLYLIFSGAFAPAI